LVNEETQKILKAQLDNNEILENNFLGKCIEVIQAGNESYSNSCQKFLSAAEDKIMAIKFRLVKTLKFPTMAERLDTIDDAHCKTFQWIFQESSENERPWSSFID
jgi:hypothetical protein